MPQRGQRLWFATPSHHVAASPGVRFGAEDQGQEFESDAHQWCEHASPAGLKWEGAAAQGQEALISYGLQSNDRLMQFYGFVESKNPADTYVMTTLPERLQASACSRFWGLV